MDWRGQDEGREGPGKGPGNLSRLIRLLGGGRGERGRDEDGSPWKAEGSGGGP